MSFNSHGEIADFLDVSQFLPGKSAYECVAYCGALVKFCGPPGKGPTGSVLQASNLAQFWYGKEEGSTDSSNKNGMSLDAEYNMLSGMGLHYQALSSLAEIKDAVMGQSRPVLLCGTETGMVDMGLGDRVPYNWTPTGNHCIVVSGTASDGNLLVHDCANVDANGAIRPGPRTYDANRIQVVSATAVIPAWQGASMIPQGWHDDGTTLTAPNGVPVVLGFRAYVLRSAWDKDNYSLGKQFYTEQLEGSNPDLGPGDQQVFRKTLLAYPHNPQGNVASLKDTVIEEYIGVELLYRLNLYSQIYSAYQAQKLQLEQLTAQLAQSQQMPQLYADMQQVKAIAQKY